MLTLDGWYCRVTHGNKYQSGLPDIYCCHRRYGTRWVEVKRPTGYRFTNDQVNVFHRFASKGIGVWVLTSEQDHERNKLFAHANWWAYLSTGSQINVPIDKIPKKGPEAKIQNSILDRLTTACKCTDPPNCSTHHLQNWFCIETYGTMYQSGFPDIYCCHKKFGARWIECKNPKGYRFTPAQLDVFPQISAHGVPLHILVDSHEQELNKIFGPSNWFHFLG